MDMQQATHRLAATIIRTAIEDWRRLVRSKAWKCEHSNPECNFDEIRGFFRSGLCDHMLDALGLNTTAGDALEMLEKELAEAKKVYGDETTKRFRTEAKRVRAVEDGAVFDSISAAARFYKVCYSCIRDAIDNPRRKAAGNHWISL